jgi:predicted Zn-dependent peptidase
MQIEQTTLPSGLAVISARLPEFESAAVMVVVRAGSRDEDDAHSGAAHFLEHMAFKGTATRTALEIAMRIERLGAQINAFTSQEMTAYHITGLKDALPDALEILGDVLTRSRFDVADVALERGVIAQEIARKNDDPGALCSEGFVATAYPGHPLGRTVLGDPAFVARATRDDLLDFVGRNYTTRRMVVVASGDIAHDWLCEQAALRFADIPGGSGVGERVAPVYAGGQHIHARADFKQVNLALGFPSVAVDAPGFLAHKLMSLALGYGMSSPLFQEVRQKRGLVYGVGAGSNHGSDAGMVAIQAGMTPENLVDVIDVACGEAKRCGAAIEEGDFVRARNAMLSELASVKERPFQLALYLAGQFFRHGTARGPQSDVAALRQVTIEDLVGAAATVFAGAPTLSLVGPVPEGDYLATVRAALG